MGAGDGCDDYVPTADPGDTGHPNENATCTGWTPVGDATTAFTGSLEGAGYTIRKLYVNIASGANRGGLFGQTGRAGVVKNVGLTNAYIKVDTRISRVGSLVGEHRGNLSNSYATGSVSGGRSFASTIGGLVGNNQGNLSNSYTTASVSGSGISTSVGGLVGRNWGSISNSYATGSLSGSGINSYVGGLMGRNDGSLSNSYATGSPTGGSGSYIGGLLGENSGSISNSYATGSPTGGSSSYIGGLVGWNNAGSISNSYATGSISGPTARAGGLVGRNDGSLSNSYATGSVSGSGRIGALVGDNNANSGDSNSISGKNYFVDSDAAPDGVRNGSCDPGASCTRAEHAQGVVAGETDEERRQRWLQDTLDESTANNATPAGLGWLPANWGNFSGTGIGYPKLKYAQVDAYCSASPTTLTTPDLCLAAGSCSGGTGSNRDACVRDDGMWTPTNTWLAGGDECGGSTGVVCGDVIGGQD